MKTKLTIGAILFLYSLPCFAHNTTYLPGDAFFFFRVNKKALQQMEKEKSPIVFYGSHSNGARGCGSLGFSSLELTDLPIQYTKGLKLAFRLMRDEILMAAPVDHKTINVFIYNKNYDWLKYKLGMQYNENWIVEIGKWGYPTDHAIYEEFIPFKTAASTIWRNSSLVEPLLTNKPEIPNLKESNYYGGRSKLLPLKMKGDYQFIVLPDRNFEDYFKMKEGLKLLAIDKFSISEYVSQNNSWKLVRKHVVLENQSNFRDLGGYQNEDGLIVKRHQVYRSGELVTMTEHDKSQLKNLQIRKIINLLTDQEIQAMGYEPHQFPQNHNQDEIPVVRIPLSGATEEQLRKVHSAMENADFSEITPEFNQTYYRRIVCDAPTLEKYAQFLKEVAHNESRPIVFHCSEGVDRTGTAAAILLWTLEVPWYTIREDYLLTNQLRKEEVKKQLELLRFKAAVRQGTTPDKVDMTNIEAFYKLKGKYINGVRKEILETYGSLDNFLTKGLKLTRYDIKQLRERLLVQPPDVKP